MGEEQEKRILLVDDEPVIAIGEADKIRGHGFTVETVYSGRQALELMTENTDYDLILMDIDLGGPYDGTEAARQILDAREVPLIFLTGHEEPEIVDKVKNIIHYGYVLKSSGEHVIVESINMALKLFETQKQLADEKHLLQAREAELQSLYDYTPVVLVLVDGDRRIKKANSLVKEITGKNPEDIIETRFGRVMQCINHLNDRGGCGYGPACKQCKIRHIILDTLKNGNKYYKTEATVPVAIREEIREFTYLVSSTPLPFRNEKTALVALADITDRITAEQELTKAKNLALSILENAPLPIFLKDADRKFLYVNQRNLELWNLKPEEIIGKIDLDVWGPEMERIYRESDEKLLSDGKIQTTEETVQFRTGTRHIWKTKFPVRDADGNIWAIGGIAMDISEKLKREQELSRLVKQNEQLLVEMNHRIANNLANVQALARIELSAENKSKEESINDLINRIQAVGIIHDKLCRTKEFSSINTGKYLEELAETIISSFSNRKDARRCRYAIDEVRLSTKINTTLGLITAELLTNTIKHASCNVECTIEISMRQKKDTVEFRYKDSGTGLPPTIKKIDDFPTGTGLLLIKELARGIGAAIEVSTGKGTEFRFLFQP